MDAFESSRVSAAKLHEIAVARGAVPRDPASLVAQAAAHLELELLVCDPGDPVLKGARALYDAQSGAIVHARGCSEEERLVLIGHELGHACLEGESTECRDRDVDASRPTEEAPVGVERVEDYGVRERRELRANVFAREFLFPRSVARGFFLDEGRSASEIAAALRLPKDLVRQQLLDALLLPPVPPEAPPAAASHVLNDLAQELAVRHRGGAFQLQAGPGTGKTKTLVARVLSLVAEGVDPASILVLTFSNRAAGELADRIGSAAKDAAGRMWIGTFHAFGLDLVRRHHDEFPLPADPALFDRGDAIAVLEDLLPTLSLRHYRNLWDPAYELAPILAAISRAKDELVDAKRYRELASAMLCAAASDEAKATAEKALEVAEVYRHYEAALERKGAVDFGDLVMRPALLLERSTTIRAAARLRHRHVLVDEYQDVNRASARLLKALAGNGDRLWVVGDSRQSIYRFRGASSHNMAAFSNDFPGAKAELLTQNYRSTQEIVTAFEAFAADMGASEGMLPLKLDAKRGRSGSRPEIRACGLPEEELRAVAAAVKELESEGVPLRAQAVLCRGNDRLGQIADVLERHGIPVLHLGSLFEREEVRDLLSILALVVDAWGSSLVRVGGLGRYAVPLQDAYRTIRHARASGVPALELLSRPDAIPGLSEEGARGLSRLAQDLAGIAVRATQWDALATYLLDRSDLVRTLANGASVRDRMRGIAVWQLMNFARSAPSGGPLPPIVQTLDRVRRLVLLAEERDLRHLPDAALHMDAVRMMTVHGSKGLEFEAVHVPGLAVSSFPTNPRTDRCRPPDGMIAEAAGRSGAEESRRAHEHEEECLFFVAMSRARSRLRIYRSKFQAGGARKRSPSPYLERIRACADEVDAPQVLDAHDAPADRWRVAVEWPPAHVVTHQDASAYDRCGRKFFYTNVLELGGLTKLTPFTKTHACLRELIDWLAARRPRATPALAETEAEFDRIWERSGPKGHAFEAEYRSLASGIIRTLFEAGGGRRFAVPDRVPIDFPHGRLVVEADESAHLPDGTRVLRRVRTGKRRAEESDDIVYALYHLAAEGGPPTSVEALSLTDGKSDPVALSAKKIQSARAKAGEIVRDLKAGDFAPSPNQQCPRCPHFFLCAAVAPGPIRPE